MPRMVSRINHEYNAVKLRPGDQFDAEQIHVGTLIAVGHAELLPERAQATYDTKVMTAQEPRGSAKRRST